MDKQIQAIRVGAKKEWEIDPLNLVVGKVIGRGINVIVRKGFYDRYPVAGKVFDFGDDDKGITEGIVESSKRHFMQEVSVWNKLDHPNVVKMIGATMNMPDFSRKSNRTGRYCIVAEYMEGGSLRSYLRKNMYKKLPFKTVIQFALDIARGLSYLHSKKIVHRDVKPENLLLDKNHRTVKITDFGESLFEPSDFYTRISGEIGTCGYMAPEVVSGKAYGHKCDVYSFGICLWEIYCCEVAYSYGTTTLEDIPASVYQYTRPNIPVCCPRSLARLMERCWDTDPKKRPEMKEVVQELEEIYKSEGCKMTPLNPPLLSCFTSTATC